MGATVGLARRRLNAAGLALLWYAGETANLLNRSVLLQEEAPLGTVGKLRVKPFKNVTRGKDVAPSKM